MYDKPNLKPQEKPPKLNLEEFPLKLYGSLSLVLPDPVLWIVGENPVDKAVQRLVLLFEKENCQFITNENIDIGNVRAGVEREIKQRYDQEQEMHQRQSVHRRQVMSGYVMALTASITVIIGWLILRKKILFRRVLCLKLYRK